MMEELTQWTITVLQGYIQAIGIIIFACGILWIFEYARPATADHGLNGRMYNIKLFSLVFLGLLILPFISRWIKPYLPNVSLIEILLPGWKRNGWLGALTATLIYAFVWDFFQYWVHRLQHAIPALWVFHQVHHSDQAMNASTSIRQSFGSIMLGYFFVHIPTFIVCGGGLLPFVGSIVLFSGWGYFNHANFRITFGRMAWLISGPQLHRLHHGKSKDYYDSNYAAFFPFLDFIYGTLHMPEKNEWPETGIINDTSSKNPILQVFFPWYKR